MSLNRKVCAGSLLLGIAGSLIYMDAGAQRYPVRPIRLIVGFPVGGAADIVARIVGQKLGERFQQQIVVDNRSGAGGVIAAEITAKAAPDGYTLLMISSSYAVNAGFRKKLPYDLVKDFAAVTLVASAPLILIGHPSLPARAVSELIEMARARPGQLNLASSGGSGTITHLTGELLKLMANIDLTHVPYKGAAPALTDLISGQVQLAFSSLPAALPQIKAGRVKAIAVTSAKRAGAAPDIPTIAESGVAGYDATNWYGVLAPAATPKRIVGSLNAGMLQVLRSPDVADAITRQGADPLGSTPEEFERYMKAEIAKWTKVIRDAGVRPE
ncbi:MAG: tripartite tricarboxylate transporter substrate binding protein [Betaproteobacteria bacterium]|nr:tripartite tricarboxylate transporter substrate binding protein [Betaproteobacteria bacterium]